MKRIIIFILFLYVIESKTNDFAAFQKANVSLGHISADDEYLLSSYLTMKIVENYSNEKEPCDFCREMAIAKYEKLPNNLKELIDRINFEANSANDPVQVFHNYSQLLSGYIPLMDGANWD